jgi:hypothetical protein
MAPNGSQGKLRRNCQKIIALNKTNRNWVFTFTLPADAIGAEGVFDAFAACKQLA